MKYATVTTCGTAQKGQVNLSVSPLAPLPRAEESDRGGRKLESGGKSLQKRSRCFMIKGGFSRGEGSARRLFAVGAIYSASAWQHRVAEAHCPAYYGR